MTDIEGISDRTSREKPRAEFDRLFPDEGITIGHGNRILVFRDVNDIPKELRAAASSYYEKEIGDNPNLAMPKIEIGSTLNRKFRIYVFADSNFLGVYTFVEIMDNPHGYGAGDCLLQKFIMPEYRKIPLGRRASNDIMFLVFRSGLINRWYAYFRVNGLAKSKDDVKNLREFDRVDQNNNPCFVVFNPNDSYAVQKWANIERTVESGGNLFGIFEADGFVYRQMDWQEYATMVGKAMHGERSNMDKIQRLYNQLLAGVERIMKSREK